MFPGDVKRPGWLMTDARHGNSILNNEQHLFTRVKKLRFFRKGLESGGNCVFDRSESQGWLNENLKNSPLPEDRRVSCLSDTGFVSLPELTGGDSNAG